MFFRNRTGSILSPSTSTVPSTRVFDVLLILPAKILRSEDLPDPEVPSMAVREAGGKVPNVEFKIVRLTVFFFLSTV
jgi:hypothetical protein